MNIIDDANYTAAFFDSEKILVVRFTNDTTMIGKVIPADEESFHFVDPRILSFNKEDNGNIRTSFDTIIPSALVATNNFIIYGKDIFATWTPSDVLKKGYLATIERKTQQQVVSATKEPEKKMSKKKTTEDNIISMVDFKNRKDAPKTGVTIYSGDGEDDKEPA